MVWQAVVAMEVALVLEGGFTVDVGEGGEGAMELTSTHWEPFPYVPPLQTLVYVPSAPRGPHGYPASGP